MSDIYLPNHGYRLHLELPLARIVDFQNHRRLKLYNAKGTACAECGIDCNRFIFGEDCTGGIHPDLYDEKLTVMMTVGHIIPRSKGGKWELSNLRPLCHRCNDKEGSSVVHLCQNPQLFEQHLKGRRVRRMSGNPFAEGQDTATISKAFLHASDGWKFAFEEGGTYFADKVKFI